jgi:TonB family protein
MITPLKESLEVGEVPVSQGSSRPKPDSGQLRSDAVSLDVPVKVHGSRVVEVIRGTTPHTEPFEEQTNTMIVFPLGGVLKMSTRVNLGQAIVLTNLKTRQEAICRVIKIRTNPNLHSYVEVEFSHPQPGYWGVRFPSDAPEPPKKAASPVASASVGQTPVAPALAAPSISKPAPKIDIPKVEISKAETPKIEAKEQKAAPIAPPVSAAPVSPMAQAPIGVEKHAPIVAPQSSKSVVEMPSLAAPTTVDSSSFSLDQLRADSGIAPIKAFSSGGRVEPAEAQETESHSKTGSSITDEPVTAAPSAFGRFLASATSGEERSAARPAFGAGLEYSPVGAAPEKGRSQGKNWILVAACVGLLFVAAGGGGFYFLYQRPATRLVAATIIPQPPAAVSAPSNSIVATPGLVQPANPAVTSSATEVNRPAGLPAVEARARQAEPNRAIKPVPARPVQTPDATSRPESPKQNSATVVPDMFGALNAHPTAAVHGGTAENGAAPSIQAGALAGGESVALPSSEPSPANLAPPTQPAPEGPVPVGGEVTAPRPISSAPVVYPEIARQAGVEGNVVVRIVIDTTGKVTDARALSGPILLRDAAVRSLRESRYVPSKLDGHPISVEMLVTIQFRR